MKIGYEGTRVGRYVVDKELGTGGIAHVYLARHEQSGQIVALRVLHKLEPDIIEAEKQGALYHQKLSGIQSTAKYVPRFFESGEIDGRFYVAMEFVGGATLQGGLPVDDAVRVVQKICDALAGLHDVCFEA